MHYPTSLAEIEKPEGKKQRCALQKESSFTTPVLHLESQISDGEKINTGEKVSYEKVGKARPCNPESVPRKSVPPLGFAASILIFG